MMERPLDPGYAAAARDATGRRPVRRPPVHAASCSSSPRCSSVCSSPPRRSRCGRRPSSASKAKAQLIDQIEGRRAHGDAQSRRITALRSEINAAQAAALRSQSEGRLANDLRDLEAVTGAGAVTGPGMRLTLDDAPAKDASKNAGRQPAQQRRARPGAGDRPRPADRRQRAVGGRRRGHLGQRPAADVQVGDPLRRPGHPGQLPAADPPLRHHRHRRPQVAARRVRRERRRQLPAVAEDQLRHGPASMDVDRLTVPGDVVA